MSEEAAALSLRKRIAREAGQIEAMVGFTDQLIGIIDRLPSDEDRARAMAAVAQSYMLRDQIEATYEWADKAASLAETLDLTDVRVAAMVDKGTAMLNARDRVLEGRRLLQTAADEAERIGDHVLAARALNYLVWDARQWSDVGEVREMIERAHRQAEAAGFELVAAIDLAANQAHLEAVEGDLDAAIAHLDNAALHVSGQRRLVDRRPLARRDACGARTGGRGPRDRPALHGHGQASHRAGRGGRVRPPLPPGVPAR